MKNLILVFTVFLLSVSGCKTSGTNSNNRNSNSNSAVQPSKNVSDSKEELLNAFKKFRNVPFAAVKSVRTGNNAATILEQYSAADSSFSRKTEDGEGFETIIVGSETYSRNNSYWEWKKESESNTTASERFFSGSDQLAKYIPNFEIAADGEESVNGKTARLYNLTLSKPHPEVPSLIKIWIGKDNGLPLKRYNDFEGGSLTMTWDYESAVKIERPVVGKK